MSETRQTEWTDRLTETFILNMTSKLQMTATDVPVKVILANVHLFFLCLGIYSPLSGGHDGVHHLDDPVQRRVGADGHVGAAEVIVDGADHADNVELRVTAGCFLIDQT